MAINDVTDRVRWVEDAQRREAEGDRIEQAGLDVPSDSPWRRVSCFGGYSGNVYLARVVAAPRGIGEGVITTGRREGGAPRGGALLARYAQICTMRRPMRSKLGKGQTQCGSRNAKPPPRSQSTRSSSACGYGTHQTPRHYRGRHTRPRLFASPST